MFNFKNISELDKFLGDIFTPNKNRINMKEEENEYIATLELPGIPKDKISIEYKNDTLNIFINETDNDILQKKDKDGIIIKSVLAPNVDYINAKAKYNEGLLTVFLPKKEIIDKSYLIKIE